MPRDTVSTLAEIGNERLRQMASEGWDFKHDDAHTDRSLALVASLYASPIVLHEVTIRGGPYITQVSTHDPWPGRWDRRWDKRQKHDERRRLIIAAALLVAEIERLDRAELAAR